MPPVRLILLFVVAVFLVTVVQIGILQVAFSRLGLSADSATMLLMLTLFGSMLNLPLFTVPTDPVEQEKRLLNIPRMLLKRIQVIPGRTIIAVNDYGTGVEFISGEIASINPESSSSKIIYSGTFDSVNSG